MRFLLLPLHGAFFVIFVAVLVTKVVALIDAATRPERAFVAAGKQTKTFWIVLLALAVVSTVGSFISLLGLVAAIVYLVDVRPAVRQA
jgi:hypothetical protein